jgi:hypothetical protein
MMPLHWAKASESGGRRKFSATERSEAALCWAAQAEGLRSNIAKGINVLALLGLGLITSPRVEPQTSRSMPRC